MILALQTSSFNPKLYYQQNLSGSPSGIIANIRAIHPSTLFPPSLPFGVQARNKSPIPCFFYTLDLAVVPYWGSKSADFLSALAWKSAENLPCSSETNNPNSRDFTHSQYFNWNLIWWFVLEPLSHGFIHHIEAWTIKPLCRSSISLPFPPLSDFCLPPLLGTRCQFMMDLSDVEQGDVRGSFFGLLLSSLLLCSFWRSPHALLMVTREWELLH